MDRAHLKQLAKDNLKRNYIKILLLELIAGLLLLSLIQIDISASETIGVTLFNITFELNNTGLIKLLLGSTAAITIYQFLISPVVEYGLLNKLKYYSYSDDNQFDFFIALKENYKGVFVVNFMTKLTIGLWTLLLIIPGIIAMYKYRYVNEIYEEHPQWNYKQVMEESARLTQGHKEELFMLDLSFFLWYLLTALCDVLTLGLASYLLKPYVDMTNVYAYHYLKSQNYNSIL